MKYKTLKFNFVFGEGAKTEEIAETIEQLKKSVIESVTGKNIAVDVIECDEIENDKAKEVGSNYPNTFPDSPPVNFPINWPPNYTPAVPRDWNEKFYWYQPNIVPTKWGDTPESIRNVPTCKNNV